MKNLLLLVSVALVSLTSCQKDHYLDDLNAAKMEIAVLNGRVSNISAELQAALDRNKELSIELTSIELEITQLNIAFTSITNEANQANITVLLDLEVIINELNQDITVLQSEINELLAQEVVDTATIEILTETIVTIEAQTVNHTIEYVNTVNEVITNTDSTDYALIDALNVRIAELEALLAGIGVTPDPIDVVTPDPIDVVTETVTVVVVEEEVIITPPAAVTPSAIGFLELQGASVTSLNRSAAHTVKVTGWTIAGQLEYENAVRNYNPTNIADSRGSASNAHASFQADVVGVVEFARQYNSGHERSGIAPNVQVTIRYTLAPNAEVGYVGGNFSVSYTQNNTELNDFTYNGANVVNVRHSKIN